AEHHCLPQPAECSNMHAGGCVPHIVGQIDLRRLPEIVLSEWHFAEACRKEGMNCGTERAAVVATGLVVVEIHSANIVREAIPKEMNQHQDVRLLDDLRLRDALTS